MTRPSASASTADAHSHPGKCPDSSPDMTSRWWQRLVSDIEEGGLVVALQHDIKMPYRRIARTGWARQQRTPHPRVFDRRQQRVGGVAGIVGEINPGIEM